MKNLINALMFLTLSSSPIAAAAELPPPGGPARDFQLPAIERLTLDNGLQVTLVPFGKIPKAVIRVDVRTGNLNEGDNTWLADLAGELIKEGTELRSAELVARQAARMGGQLSISTGLDQTVFNLSVLSEHTDDAIALMAESVRQPALPEAELERVRANLVRNRSVALSRPQSIARAAFSELLYPGHAYGRAFPDEQQLLTYTMDQVRDYYAENFGARRSHVLIAGKFDRDDAVAAINRQFGDWTEGPAVLINRPEVKHGFRLKLIDRPDAPQSTVIIGLPVPDVSTPEFRALAQMQTLLGGYFSSRITANIREDKGYTYSPRSRISSHFKEAYWSQSADITTEHTGAAISEILYEIDRMQNEVPSDSEVARTQSYQTGTFVLSHATPNGLLGRLSAMSLHALPDSYLTGYLSHINSISPGQYQDLAKKHLLIDQMTIVIVGDLAKIRSQIDAISQLANIERL